MGKGKAKRSESKRTQNRRNVARNKIRRITRELQHAGGQAVGKLKERLAYWQGR